MRKPMSEENIKRFPTNTPDHLSAGAIWTSIKLTDIVDIDQTQIREQYDEGVIDELKRLFNWQNPYGNDDKDKNYYPAELNEIDVVRCPQDEKKFWIIDGHHRYKAALATGKETIRAMIVNNSGNIKSLKVNDIDDLRFLQARENDDAVANRTRETKRRQIIAAMKKRPNWNLHQVAEYCNVSWQLAFAVHEELSASGEHERISKPAEKVQEAVAQPENAKKSNRELAKELGVSEGTVRKVRKISKSKKYAPDYVKYPPESRKYPGTKWVTGDCDECGALAFDALVVMEPSGDNRQFCDKECADSYAKKHGFILDMETRTFLVDVNADKDADALDKVSQKAQDYLKSSAPELEEHLKNKNWTEKQKKDFEEGVQAYRECQKKNSMPKTSDWADEKLDGYLYEEDRQRQREKAEKGKRSPEFEPQRRPTPNKTETVSAIPLRSPNNILMVVEDVINWLGSGRIEYFAALFNDRVGKPQQNGE